jgi:thioredoxin-related protein
MSQPTETDLSLVRVGSKETPLVILFQRLPNGQLAADLKGNMDPQELILQLRFIADHIEKNGPRDAPERSTP